MSDNLRSVSSSEGTEHSQHLERLSRLDTSEFTRELERFKRRGTLDLATAAETVLRAREDRLTIKDQWIILLGSSNDGSWHSAREAAFASLTRHPKDGPSILSMHRQDRGQACVWAYEERVSGADHTPQFVVRAFVSAEAKVYGPWRKARTIKVARQEALAGLIECVALLRPFLTEPEGPGSPGIALEPVLDAVQPPAHEQFPAEVQVFEDLLDAEISSLTPDPHVVAEVVDRARCGLLTISQLYAVLFRTAAPAWEHVRWAALKAAACTNNAPRALVTMHVNATEDAFLIIEGPVPVAGDARFACEAEVTFPDRKLRSDRVVASPKKVSVQAALLNVLGKLVNVPEGHAPVWGVSSPWAAELNIFKTGEPAHVLNRLQTLGDISPLEYKPLSDMPSTMAITCRCRGTEVIAYGHGTNRKDVRDSARRALLVRLSRVIESGGMQLPPAPPRNNELHLSPTGEPSVAASLVPPPRESMEQPAPESPLNESLGDEPRSSDRRSEAPPKDERQEDEPRPIVSSSFASRFVVQPALKAGWALAFDPGRVSSRACFLLYKGRTSGALHEQVTAKATVRAVSLHTHEDKEVVKTATFQLDPLEMADALLWMDGPAAHPSVGWWRAMVRFGLGLIREGAGHVALDDHGFPGWRLALSQPRYKEMLLLCEDAPDGVFMTRDRDIAERPNWTAQASTAFLNRFTSQFTASPGARLFLGELPFVTDQAEPQRHLRAFCDRIEDVLDEGGWPRIVLSLAAPLSERVTGINARLLLGVGDSDLQAASTVWRGAVPGLLEDPGLERRVRRVLRAAAEFCPELMHLADHRDLAGVRLKPATAAALLGPLAAQLACLGITVECDGRWNPVLEAQVVVGSWGPSPWDADVLSVDSILDFRWQISMDGHALDEVEMQAIAETQRSLMIIRDRTVLIDTDVRSRARSRIIRSAPAREALLHVLDRTLEVDGERYACHAGEGMSALLERLEQTPDGTLVAEQPAALKRQLKPYQLRGLDWLVRLTDLGFGVCLADQPGLGKTTTAVALHLHRQATGRRSSTLVLCPKSIHDQWAREIENMAPSITVVRYHGQDRYLPVPTNDMIVVTTYGTLIQDRDDLITHQTWGIVIADEAQLLKNERTQANKHAAGLRCDVRLALTGTPLENNVEELRTIMDWANPDLFGSRSQFRRLFGKNIAGNDTEALDRISRIFRPFILRRTKDDPNVDLNLPPKTGITHLIDLSDEQRGMYDNHTRDLEIQINESPADNRGQLRLILMEGARHIANSPDHYSKMPLGEFGTDLAANRRRAPKLQRTEELIARAVERGEGVLVFTSFAVMANLIFEQLTRTGFKVLMISGDVDLRDRSLAVDRFQAGQEDVLVLTKRTGGVGLNLARASTVIHFEPGWNPGVEDQATDRAHRIGQRKDVTVHHLISRYTIEEKMGARLINKRALAHGVLQTGDPDFSDFSTDELLNIARRRTR